MKVNLTKKDQMETVIAIFFDYCFGAEWTYSHIAKQVKAKYKVNSFYCSCAYQAAKSIALGTKSDSALNSAMDNCFGKR
jgi:hypothetical protein